MALARGLGKGVFGRSLGSGPSESLSVVLVQHVHMRRYRLRRGRSEGVTRTNLCEHRPSGMAKPYAKTEPVGSSTERSGVLDRSRWGDNLMG